MRSSKQIKKEIEERFGFFPPFFSPAMDAPEVLENLWQQTLSEYVNSPLPALFKEKLFAYLSRYCSVPYCIICHSCALHPLAMSAGDILELLERPTPFAETAIDEYIGVLAASTGTLAAWPDPGSSLEQSLFWCSVFTFLHPSRARRCQHEIRRLLGDRQYAHWAAFLSYVKTCHFWVETHPDLSYEADERFKEHYKTLIKGEPHLNNFFQHYREKVDAECKRREEHLADEIIQLKLMEKALKEGEEKYHQLFERETDAVMLINAETLQFEEVNQAATGLFGYSKEEFLSLKIYDISAEKDKTKEAVRRLKNGSPGRNIIPLRYMIRKDGAVFPAQISTGTFMSQGRMKLIGVVSDITEQKQAKDKLERAYSEVMEKKERLERFQKVAVGRELEMVKLKKEVNELLEETGKAKKY